MYVRRDAIFPARAFDLMFRKISQLQFLLQFLEFGFRDVDGVFFDSDHCFDVYVYIYVYVYLRFPFLE